METVNLFTVYLFLITGIRYTLEGDIPRNYIAILAYFLFKMITLYDKCTLSYIECKLRNVKKENGYLNRFLHSIIDLRDTPHVYPIYIIGIILILIYTSANAS
jgi:hypothetical protein